MDDTIYAVQPKDSKDATQKAAPAASPSQATAGNASAETHCLVTPQRLAPRPWSDVPLEELRARLADFARERDWDQYHTPRNLLLALVGESGELAELFQWRREVEAGPGLPGFTEAERGAVAEELADVLLYLVRLSDMCGVDLGAAALAKMMRNAARYPPERCRGSSAKYTEYSAAAGQQPPGGRVQPTEVQQGQGQKAQGQERQ